MAYTPKSLLGPLPPDSGPTPKKILHANTTHELYNIHLNCLLVITPVKSKYNHR